MKDKRQRMAITWPYGIPPDPQIYAYLAAAAASYPYALPNPAAATYPSIPLPGLYQSQVSTSSAFSPLTPQAPLKPMFDTLPPFPPTLGAPAGLDRLPTSSEATSIDSLTQRYKSDSSGIGPLPGVSPLKPGCPCGLPTCSLSSGLHPSFPTSLPSSFHPGLHPSLSTSSLPGLVTSPLNPLFQKPELTKQWMRLVQSDLKHLTFHCVNC